jgi:hypothetical protein
MTHNTYVKITYVSKYDTDDVSKGFEKRMTSPNLTHYDQDRSDLITAPLITRTTRCCQSKAWITNKGWYYTPVLGLGLINPHSNKEWCTRGIWEDNTKWILKRQNMRIRWLSIETSGKFREHGRETWSSVKYRISWLPTRLLASQGRTESICKNFPICTSGPGGHLLFYARHGDLIQVFQTDSDLLGCYVAPTDKQSATFRSLAMQDQHYDPSKRMYLLTSLHDAAFQTEWIFSSTAVRTRNIAI